MNVNAINPSFKGRIEYQLKNGTSQMINTDHIKGVYESKGFLGLGKGVYIVPVDNGLSGKVFLKNADYQEVVNAYDEARKSPDAVGKINTVVG